MSVEFEPIESRGTAAAAMERIAAAIRQGRFGIGDRLPSERDLAQQMGVSRQTIRKAIHALADAGVLEILSGQGARSGARVATDVVPLELGARATPPNIGEIAGVLEARRLFEPRVAVLAGFLMNDQDYQAINEVLELQRNARDLEGVRDLDVRFHLAIARATHNRTIVVLMQALMEQLNVARYVVPLDPDEDRRTIEIHERTLEAIASRDQQRIESVMDEHLGMMEAAWQQASGRALPRTVPDFLLNDG
ncbi:FadR/GntR family transcriptional regulator [Patulibacter defluvii]|uniref:FadR/GntR family transcriptional regulator n=1 Tax=Patulibacter defluvii TaxID=3095358 RepID=UPI002A759F60|nr:FCD domain-containing protein [Patulibacter sp. DM4]